MGNCELAVSFQLSAISFQEASLPGCGMVVNVG